MNTEYFEHRILNGEFDIGELIPSKEEGRREIVGDVEKGSLLTYYLGSTDPQTGEKYSQPRLFQIFYKTNDWGELDSVEKSLSSVNFIKTQRNIKNKFIKKLREY